MIASAVLGGVVGSMKPVDAIPNAKVSDRQIEQSIEGTFGVGIVANDTAFADKLGELISVGTSTRQKKDGSTEEYPVAKYRKNEDVQIFFAVREAAYPLLMDKFPFEYRGGIILQDKEEDAEKRIIQLMLENGIQSYEIISL